MLELRIKGRGCEGKVKGLGFWVWGCGVGCRLRVRVRGDAQDVAADSVGFRV